jgi:hypothetical protein
MNASIASAEAGGHPLDQGVAEATANSGAATEHLAMRLLVDHFPSGYVAKLNIP